MGRLPRLKETEASKTRRLKLLEIMASDKQPHRVLLDGRRFMDPITEETAKGSIEIWEFVKTTQDAHPIHIRTLFIFSCSIGFHST